MSKVRRLRVTDRIFFVTANLVGTASPLTESEYPLIVEAFESSRRRLGFLLCGYVLMPDHWHALVSTHYPLTISRVVRDVKQLSARAINAASAQKFLSRGDINRARRRRGSLWQHQFWDRFVRNAKEFAARLEYMHLNPVRKGLVARPEDWRWSSCNNFALERTRVIASPIQVDYVRLPDTYRG